VTTTTPNECRAGATVHGRDEDLGEVAALVIDPITGEVSHLVLSRRHLFRREKVTVPLAAVDRYGHAVHLKVTKDELESSEDVPLGASPGRFDAD
jgi:sporulation protein YlmC with PRC-barrel domain